ELAGTDPNASPVRESAAPEPKTATVERREASVLRRTQGASPGAWPAALRAGPTGASQAPVRLSALRPPLHGVREARKQNPGAKNAPRERERLFTLDAVLGDGFAGAPPSGVACARVLH